MNRRRAASVAGMTALLLLLTACGDAPAARSGTTGCSPAAACRDTLRVATDARAKKTAPADLVGSPYGTLSATRTGDVVCFHFRARAVKGNSTAVDAYLAFPKGWYADPNFDVWTDDHRLVAKAGVPAIVGPRDVGQHVRLAGCPAGDALFLGSIAATRTIPTPTPAPQASSSG